MTSEADFADVVRKHGPMIARIAAAHEARPELAEELVQEIWFAIWRALPSFQEQSTIRTFVARIASNRAATHVARAMAAPPAGEVDDDLADDSDGPETEAVARDVQIRLIEAVRSLSLLSRQVVTLTLEGLGPGEIAAVLGLSANAVSIRLTRAKTELRKKLGEQQ